MHPWHIQCEEDQYLAAVKWILSKKGGQLWKNSESSIYIIDPHCKVDYVHLYQLLSTDSQKHGWYKDDLRFRPSDDETQSMFSCTFTLKSLNKPSFLHRRRETSLPREGCCSTSKLQGKKCDCFFGGTHTNMNL